MKQEIMDIIEKHTPTTTYVDGANAADEILSAFVELQKQHHLVRFAEWANEQGVEAMEWHGVKGLLEEYLQNVELK